MVCEIHFAVLLVSVSLVKTISFEEIYNDKGEGDCYKRIPRACWTHTLHSDEIKDSFIRMLEEVVRSLGRTAHLRCDHKMPRKTCCIVRLKEGSLCKQCPDGKWGVECDNDCTCQIGEDCDSLDGNCTCKKGWTGESCEEACPEGRYGYFCKEECKCQNDATCDHISGRCNCKSGYQGPLCMEKCPKDSHGYNCSEECKCQNNATCHHEDGSCSCSAGWTGPICTERCEEGYFGINCSEKCTCYNGAACDVITGQCTCRAGIYGEKCDFFCPEGTWGFDCSQECNCTNGKCNAVDGSCSCYSGYRGKNCNERARVEKHVKSKEDSTGVNAWFVAFLISSLLLALLLISFGVMFYRKRIQIVFKDEHQTLLPSFSDLINEEH